LIRGADKARGLSNYFAVRLPVDRNANCILPERRSGAIFPPE
jgi:hypothetical protein